MHSVLPLEQVVHGHFLSHFTVDISIMISLVYIPYKGRGTSLGQHSHELPST